MLNKSIIVFKKRKIFFHSWHWHLEMLLHSTPVHGQKQSLIQISTVEESPIPCPTKQIGAVADDDPCSMLNEQADESKLTYVCICY